MKKSRYSESQIIQIINEGESGVPITDICQEHGVELRESRQRIFVYLS